MSDLDSPHETAIDAVEELEHVNDALGQVAMPVHLKSVQFQPKLLGCMRFNAQLAHLLVISYPRAMHCFHGVGRWVNVVIQLDWP